MKKNKVIFLCTGNICRSPIGEGLLKHAISALPETDPLKKLVICSAGTSAMTGMPASQHSVDVLEKVGVDISQHKATQLNSALLEECFALFAMEDTHLMIAKSRFSKSMPKRAMTVKGLNPNADDKNISDPFGGDFLDYEFVRDEVAESIPFIVKYLKEQLSENE